MSILRNFLQKKIFISYAHEYKSKAEDIALALRSRGHAVFLDQDDLPVGRSYDDRIQFAMQSSDVIVFLISPQSVAKGAYTLTELGFARQKWRNPEGHVLPVAIAKTKMSDVPAYLKSVTILQARGNLAAEVGAAVEQLSGATQYKALFFAGTLALLGAFAGLFSGLLIKVGSSWNPLMVRYLIPGFLLGLVIGYGVWVSGQRHMRYFIATVIAIILARIAGLYIWFTLRNEFPGFLDYIRYFVSGAIFAAISLIGLVAVSPIIRRNSAWLTTLIIGGLCWSFAYFFARSSNAYGVPGSLLYWMVWQGAYAAWIGYLLSSAPQTKETII